MGKRKKEEKRKNKNQKRRKGRRKESSSSSSSSFYSDSSVDMMKSFSKSSSRTKSDHKRKEKTGTIAGNKTVKKKDRRTEKSKSRGSSSSSRTIKASSVKEVEEGNNLFQNEKDTQKATETAMDVLENEKKAETDKANEVTTTAAVLVETKEANNTTSIELRSRINPTSPEMALDIYTNFQKVNLSEIPNLHRKMVIYNLPEVNEDEIMQYFLTILNHLTPNTKILNPIVSLEKRDNGFYYIIEVATQDHLEILKNIDNTEWRGYRIRIQRPRNFFRDYNDTMGKNALPKEIKKNNMNCSDSDNKLYMSGIPTTAKENEIRAIVESFGQLKYFNLVKDPSNDDLNRGFCFFEYVSEIVTERAIKGLNNLGMGDRKFKVQRAAINNKSFTILQQLKENPVIITHEPGKSNFSDALPNSEPVPQIDIPLFASNPSRVVQFINVLTPEDLMEDTEYREIVEDIRNECMQYGTVLNVEIPRPDKTTSLAGPAVGKIFVKFSTIQSAKKGRYNLSGRRYNRRLIIGSFYPENYFDVREFNFQGDRI